MSHPLRRRRGAGPRSASTFPIRRRHWPDPMALAKMMEPSALMDRVLGWLGSHSSLGRHMASSEFQSVFVQLNAQPRYDPSAKRPVSSTWRFNSAVSVCIVVNAILIGVETDGPVRSKNIEDRVGFVTLEALFAILFLVEMLIRQHEFGWDYFIDPWNYFDFSLIVLNVADFVSSLGENRSTILEVAASLRLLRLLRVVRLIQGVAVLSSLWGLIQGMLDSLKALFWIGVLFVAITYCLAIALTTLVALDPEVKAVWPDSQVYCGSVERSFWTLVQVATFDNWMRDVARPIAGSAPTGLIVVFFAVVVLSFGVLNLIIGSVVERVLAITEAKRQKIKVSLKDIEDLITSGLDSDFRAADTSGDGMLDKEEFQELLRNPAFVEKLNLLDIGYDEAERMFGLIDQGERGAIDVEEFKQGLASLKGVARGHDLVELINRAQKMKEDCELYVGRIARLNVCVDKVQARLDRLGGRCTGELRLRNDAAARTEKVWSHASQRRELLDSWERNRLLNFPPLLS